MIPVNYAEAAGLTARKAKVTATDHLILPVYELWGKVYPSPTPSFRVVVGGSEAFARPQAFVKPDQMPTERRNPASNLDSSAFFFWGTNQ